MKKQKTNPIYGSDLFEWLPDDLVISILSKLSSTALSPSDFFTVLITCKRLNRLGLQPVVLNQAGSKMLAVRAKNWSEPAHRFLKQCVSVGNVEACYILGMIRFYCLENRPAGLSLIAKAAIKSHAPALYSLAVIQFNGSGATKSHKDLRAGVAFFARAASLGHTDALRELGHCLQDGYGIARRVDEGRRFLLQAHLRELVDYVHASTGFKSHSLCARLLQRHRLDGVTRPKNNRLFIPSLHQDDKAQLLNELYSCHKAVREPHPANKFLIEWFGSREVGTGLKICSHSGCGRPETRGNEFRRCSVCGKANYCSRGCQAQDWKVRHKIECAPLDVVEFDGFNGGDEGDDVEVVQENLVVDDM